MLLLKTLSIESMHGYGIAQHIHAISADVLTIEEGSLYPALQRIFVKRWVSSEWKISANNRRARFYTLTSAGKKQLGVEKSRFSQMFGAIMRVMKPDAKVIKDAEDDALQSLVEMNQCSTA